MKNYFSQFLESIKDVIEIKYERNSERYQQSDNYTASEYIITQMVTNDIDIEIKAFNLLVKINRWSVNWEITTALSFL